MKRNSILKLTLAMLMVAATAGKVHANACDWDPTGWICAHGEDDSASNDDGSGPTYVTVNAKQRAEIACPDWHGNTTVKDACFQPHADCVAGMTPVFDDMLKSAGCSKSGDSWSCIVGKYYKFNQMQKDMIAANPKAIAENDECRATPETYWCGNGKIDGVEVCDGTLLPAGKTGFCSSSCKFTESQPFPEAGPVCGNDKVEKGEGCDGSAPEGSMCLKCQLMPILMLSICGDGNVTGKEACDDGNNFDGDGCDSSCVIETLNPTKNEVPNDVKQEVPAGPNHDQPQAANSAEVGGGGCSLAVSGNAGSALWILLLALPAFRRRAK